ncbi:MAG: family 10 glycosylhydrolase [Nitrospirae bacterium]|nr:family 10 glycosylhydrolase [Candidatus Manganitrophaceae bacterium]
MFNKKFSRRQFIQMSTLVAAGSFCRPLMSMAQTLPTLESRAIFDEGLNWVTNASAVRLLDRIKKAGFNVFMPCVWHGMGTTWPSSLAPWTTQTPRIAGFDPLDNLIKLADGYDIEIHPWFTVTLRQREFLQQYYESGSPENAFDVHNDNFRAFISALITEVALRYPVQGINLDFMTTMGICRGAACIDQYTADTGRKLLADWNLRKLPGYGAQYLIAWQKEATTDILRRVSTKIRGLKKNILISINATPGVYDLTFQGDDSINWVDQGLSDVLYCMDYQPDPDTAKIRTWQAGMKRPQAVALLGGNFDVTSTGVVVARDAARVAQIISEARTIGSGDGVALYIYSRLSDAQIQTLSTGVFKTPAVPHWTRATVS